MGTDGASINVLCVDDEPGLANLTGKFLERFNDRLSVITRINGGDAVEYLDEKPVDCIVSDYDMPGMDGLELLEVVRATHPDLPFILFTGRGSEEIASDAISAGVTDYMQKESSTDQYQVLATRIQNVVTRYRAQDEAQRAQQRAETILTASPDAILVSVDGEHVYANAAAVDLFGAETDDDLIGTVVMDLVHPTDRDDLQSELAVLHEGEQTLHRVRQTVQALDGQPVDVEVTARAIEWDGQSGIVTILRDLTEQQRREQELRETTRQFHTVLDTVEAVVFMKDHEGRYLLMNKKCREILGLDDEQDVVGKTDEEILPADAARQLRNHDLRVFETGETINFEEDVPTVDGVRTFLTCKTPVFDDEGEPVAVCAVSTDITERKQREANLEPLQERIEFALDMTDSVLWSVNLDTGATTTLTGPIERLFGVSSERITDAETILEYASHPDDRAAVEQVYEQLLRGETERFEVKFRTHPDHSDIRWIEANAYIQADTDTRMLIGFAIDITDREERERELERQNDRLEEFASVVSHDLRNPLNVAQGRIGLAQEDAPSEHLQAAKKALDRMTVLIEDLLVLARQGTSIAEVETIALNPMIEECWQTIETADAVLSVESECRFEADKSRVRQIFENLFRNAVEHGGTDVTVTVGELADGTGLFIEDDGGGIAPNERDRIFTSGHSTKRDGTGFGLSIVKRIVNAHGWEIVVTDGSEGGARFEITGIEFGAD